MNLEIWDMCRGWRLEWQYKDEKNTKCDNMKCIFSSNPFKNGCEYLMGGCLAMLQWHDNHIR